MPDLLDIAFPPDVNTLVSDVQHAGAAMVGLYVVNWDTPSAEVPASYAQQVAGRVRVLPIITPGMRPYSVSVAVVAVQAWWAGGPVAIDIEQPGIDTPDPAWVEGLVNALAAAGYDPWIYCNHDTRPTYPWGKWWLADWEAHPNATGYVAWQFSNQFFGQSSTRYDASVLSAGALTPTAGGDMTPQEMVQVLDSLAVQVSGQTSFLSWMQSVLGTEQSDYNTLNAIKAEMDTLKLSSDPEVGAAVARIESALKAA